MYSSIRPLLFRLEPERAHNLTLTVLRMAGAIPAVQAAFAQLFRGPSCSVQTFGLAFKNPIGLAAGYDKDGLALYGLDMLGFGHIEIGTVTPLPQAGNPSPRVFRLAEDEAIINRMGFPSRGSEFLQLRLNPALRPSFIERFIGIGRRRTQPERRPLSARLGVNLGRNKETPNEQAVYDYLELLQNFAPLADYLTINVSSPNTAGLRRLQAREELETLLTHLHQQRVLEQKRWEKPVPLLVKLAPDLTTQELDEAMDAILRTGMDGVIATNTTLARPGLRSAYQGELGGLSGSPLRAQSEAALRQIVRRVEGKLPVISVGGIMSAEDAKRRLDMGAALVQVYTGLVYRGPGLVKEILEAVAHEGHRGAPKI
jgi:dihydroorotate dehydrogenase